MTRLLLAFILLLTACSSNEDATSTRTDRTLILNIATEPHSLDPGIAVDVTSINVLLNIFEGLTRATGDGNKIGSGLAETVEISQDGLTYVFTLRPSKWSNGDPVTAYDFEYAWKRNLSPSTPGRFVHFMYPIKNAREVKEGSLSPEELGVHAPDSLTLVVELRQPTTHFLELLSLPGFFPLHRATVEDNEKWAYHAGEQYVSNGPFQLVSWAHNDKLQLHKNPHYWDADKVALQQINCLMIEDANTELELFESGQIDWAGKPLSMGPPTDALPSLMREGQVSIEPLAATYYYVLNIDNIPFSNKKIRHAFARAIQRQDIVEHILQGTEQPATAAVPPPFSLQDAPYFTDGDTKTATQLFHEGLSELGISKQELPEITLSFNSGEMHHKVAQAIQQQWEQAFGVRVRLENTEWKVHLDNILQKNYTIARLSFVAAYNDPMSQLEIFKYANENTNPTSWENQDYIDLLEASLVETKTKRRLQLLRQAEATLMEDMPVIPIYHLTNSFLKTDSLKNVVLSPSGWIDFKEAYFESNGERLESAAS